jgi:hypothetical protein
VRELSSWEAARGEIPSRGMSKTLEPLFASRKMPNSPIMKTTAKEIIDFFIFLTLYLKERTKA